MQLGSPVYTTNPDIPANSNRTHFFMSGLVKQITPQSMVIDQTFGHPEYTDNSNVTIRLDRGAVFVNCGYDIESCRKTITEEQIAKGLYVCAFTRMFNGEFYAGKMWLNSSCGPFQNEITNGSPEDSNQSSIQSPPGPESPFWTALQNNTYTVLIRQGETKTVPVDLHYWKGLNTSLGIKFENPDTERGGLYNPPDGLVVSFELDAAYIQVSNGQIVDIMSYRDVKLKEPSEIQQTLDESTQMVVAEGIGSVTVSAFTEVPIGYYRFGLVTTDAQIDSKYGDTDQLLEMQVEDNV